MNHIEYQEYIFGPKRSNLKNRINGAGAYTIPRSVSYVVCNSEAWHGVTQANVASLEVVDQALLRAILNAHKGTPNEFLYLETGAMPIRWVVPQRRINFLKHILSRKETELLRKIFEAQKQHPTQGDFVRLVESDLKKLGLSYEQVSSENVSKPMLKKMLKENAQTAAFGELFEQLQRSTKTRTIKYNRLELQGYLLTINSRHRRDEHNHSSEVQMPERNKSKLSKHVQDVPTLPAQL